MSTLLDTPIDWEGSKTLREAFKLLLKTLFEEGEYFSGKRPLGNSSWEWEIGAEFIKAGILKGNDGSDGSDVAFDWEEYQTIINDALDDL